MQSVGGRSSSVGNASALTMEFLSSILRSFAIARQFEEASGTDRNVSWLCRARSNESK